ncbi:MAG: WYL domain-containing protein [Actinomycetota bacterium]|nr:WYL domain-containing protein [Actinomycetota bacterium]
MSVQAIKLERILRIVCLLAVRPRSAEQIIDILSQEPEFDWRRYSKETIYRDIHQLRSAGFTINYLKKSGAYKLESSPIRIELEPGEVVALAVACRSLPEASGLPYAKELAGALKKISALLSPESKHTLDSDPYFQMRLEPVVDYGAHRDTIEAIRRAIAMGREIEVVYYSAKSDTERKRVIDPHQLYFREGGVRLEGFCHLKRKVLEFRVDRIRKLKVLSSTAGVLADGDSFTFKLWLDQKLTRFMGERFTGQVLELNEDGSSILRARATNPFRVILQVLSYGEHAKLLEPEYLKQEMAAIVGRMVRLYGDG